MPSSLQVLMIRTAISPRLATSTFLMGIHDFFFPTVKVLAPGLPLPTSRVHLAQNGQAIFHFHCFTILFVTESICSKWLCKVLLLERWIEVSTLSDEVLFDGGRGVRCALYVRGNGEGFAGMEAVGAEQGERAGTPLFFPKPEQQPLALRGNAGSR